MIIELTSLEAREREILLSSVTHLNIHYNTITNYQKVYEILVSCVEGGFPERSVVLRNKHSKGIKEQSKRNLCP